MAHLEPQMAQLLAIETKKNGVKQLQNRMRSELCFTPLFSCQDERPLHPT
jgi:hypothetical protein